MGKSAKHRGAASHKSSVSLRESSVSRTATSQIEDDDDEVRSVSLKDSLEKLDERSDLEKELFELIDDGDISTIRELVGKYREDINVSHKDLIGHDLLTHAVESGKKKIVTLVLGIDPARIDTKEALLHAIKGGTLSIVFKLLEFDDLRAGTSLQGSSKRPSRVLSERKTTMVLDDQGNQITIPESFDESDFGSEMTPLIMAVHHGHYDIMEVLYNRGERLPDVHVPSCNCPQCRWATRDLARTQRRMNILKAKSSTLYMMFMTGQDGTFDPIFEAYELCPVIEQCAEEEPEYREEYEEILKVTKKIPVDLMNMCRSTDETKMLLSQKGGYVGPSSMHYPRLALAIEKGHKKFVAHQNVQFLLQSEYFGPVWKSSKTNLHKILKILVTLLIMVFFPVVQAFLWVTTFCCSKVPLIRYLMSPSNKSMSKLASYIYFCIALGYMNIEDRPEADIEPPTIYVRWLVMVYVLSLLLTLLRRFMYHPKAFFKSGWNIFDCVTQGAFWIAFGIWIYLFIRKHQLGYEQTLPRRRLPRNDPLLIEECAFAVASTFAALRLLKWFVLSTEVGPFQAALYRMGAVVWTVIIYVAWIVLTFSLSANVIVRPYANLSKYDEKALKMKEQPTDSMEVEKLMIAFLTDSALSPDEYEIFGENRSYITPEGKEAYAQNDHETTQWFATFFCVVFNIVVMTFLKDSVIGLFGSLSEEVLEAKEIEWKYDRAKEMLYYIQDGHLAPPFNLIPNGACLGSICGWCAGMTCSRGKKIAGCDCTQCCYLENIESPEEQEEKSRKYAFLLRNLFQRHLKVKLNKVDERATENTVEEVFVTLEEVRRICKKTFEPQLANSRNSPAFQSGISLSSSKDKPESTTSQSNLPHELSPTQSRQKSFSNPKQEVEQQPGTSDSVKILKKPEGIQRK